MTIAELARLFNEHHGIDAKLEVMPMEGWSREMYWDATDPALGDALAEHADARHGHRLSRHGALRRHHAVGGPRHHAPLRADRRAVARRRPARRAHERGRAQGRALPRRDFEPTFQKHARATCGGCQIHVTEPRGVPAGEGRRVAAPRMLRRGTETASNGAIRLTNTSTTRCRSTFWPARRRSGSRSRAKRRFRHRRELAPRCRRVR